MAKNKTPKRILGIKIPKFIRRSPFLLEALVALSGAALTAIATSDKTAEIVKGGKKSVQHAAASMLSSWENEKSDGEGKRKSK